ncbi:CD80-like C2-set immunoglobulin domain [Popillia japonica]|uniref:CD80-like C2-set immunoglobulin domain n=1 Tax=Popillia japonica TaxID=7064 RepID=A0AAW1KM32_POPJA
MSKFFHPFHLDNGLTELGMSSARTQSNYERTLSLQVDVTPREATVLENRNVSFRCQMGVKLQYCRAPREATVLENRNVSFRCQMGVKLQYCRVDIPGIGPMNLNNMLPPAKGVSYTGAGLESGQCGFTIERVTSENNGKINCYLGLVTQADEYTGTMHLTVAKAPRAPELELSRDMYGQYKVNDMLRASCIVRDGRPVANISWYLDDEPLYEGISMPTILDFPQEDLYTKVQNLTRQLQFSDNGRHLKCVATHPALEKSSVTMSQLDVLYPPLPLGNPIDKFGYEIGSPGIISVEIAANPKPKLEWSVRGETLREGGVDSTGRIQAEFAQELGRGRYVASLRIAAVNKQDTETQYVLVAYNDMGTQDYTVLISTSPEPEVGIAAVPTVPPPGDEYFGRHDNGLDLGAGGIIGIVVATLLLLVIVFVIVIARIKGKWCFSEIDRNSARAPIESSDTESADVRQSQDTRRSFMPALTSIDTESADVRQSQDTRRSFMPALTSIFKKKNDRVSHEEEAPRQMETEEGKPPLEEEQKQKQQQEQEEGEHEQPESEYKEGLVYAELDLVKTDLKPVLKNDDDKTEYAEIVYTNDNNKEQTQS